MTNNPKYVNGIVKSVMVKKIIALHELVEKNLSITKINSNEYKINLTCNWPITQGRFIVMPITDDEDTRAMLALHPSVNLIEIYVKKSSMSHQTHGEFTRMLDLDNESTCFLSLVHNT